MNKLSRNFVPLYLLFNIAQMRSPNRLQLLCFSFLLICWKVSFNQEIKDPLPNSELTASDSVGSSSDIRLLILMLSVKDAKQNDSSLFYYWKSIRNADFSYSSLCGNEILFFSNDLYLNESGSLMYTYWKIDVSQSQNLDYKTLSGKYPKTFEEKHPWGGLMLYSIISSIYPNHGYAPVLNTK